MWTRHSAAPADEQAAIAARRRDVEADGALALAELQAREAVERQKAKAVDAHGSDLHAHRIERDLLDRALATQRRWRIDAVAADPPAYVTDLLGPQPAERLSRLRWRTGLTLIEDLRAEHHLAGDPGGVTPWERAVGVNPHASAGPHTSTLRQLAEIRRDLGLARPVERAVDGRQAAVGRSASRRHAYQPPVRTPRASGGRRR